MEINDVDPWVAQLRQDFHQHPELSGQEFRTTRKIHDILVQLGADLRTFDDCTGVSGCFYGKGSKNRGITLAVRADIDGLPVSELSNNSFRSQNKGVMHACGHDANIAIALGVAKRLVISGLLDRTGGAVKFIFQPAEEALGGAKALIDRGVLENPQVDYIIAGHMDPEIPVGKVGVFKRLGHAASDSFCIEITGEGAHGARPHQGINPIRVGSDLVVFLDGIVSRCIRPDQSAVISVGSFHAGEADNVIPETAEIKGSFRTHEKNVRSRMIHEIRRSVKALEGMYGVRCRLILQQDAPAGLNDETVSRILRRASEDILGKENVNVLPFIMGSDDFYYFAQKCPGAMIRLGCAPESETSAPPLHSPFFDIHEDVLKVGVQVLYRAVERLLCRH